jgi:outer membrane protein, heavy metal efflux system
MRTRLALVILLLNPAPALAGDPAPAHLRWRDIVRLAEAHPLIGEARHRLDAARGRLSASAQIPNPTLEARVGGAVPRETAAGARVEWGLTLALPLEWLAQRGPSLAAARAGVKAAEHEARRLRLEVLLRLRALFWQLAHDQALTATLRETEAQVARFARLVRRRVDKGEARPIEATRVETELERLRIELERALVQQRTRGEQLRLWLGGRPVVVVADLASTPPLPALTGLLATLRREHPSVAIGRARISALSAELRLEERKRLPALSFAAGYEVELDRRGFGGVLTVGLPLWSWNSGRIAQARSRQAAEQQRLEAATRDLLHVAIEAHGLCAQGALATTRYRERIVPGAVKAAATLERSFQLGEASLLEVLDARRVLLEVRRGFAAAQLQRQLDCSTLQSLTGEIAHD